MSVAPHVGAWIEISRDCHCGLGLLVAPHVGAWIEIYVERMKDFHLASHPTWVRGLKCQRNWARDYFTNVAPHVGAWIEMGRDTKDQIQQPMVAPHVGAWIEINGPSGDTAAGVSHPTWVRGLKSLSGFRYITLYSRTPRGCVD